MFTMSMYSFQQVLCFHYNAINSWYGHSKYKQGQTITCDSCNETFQHLWCPHCFGANYFSNCDYDEGDRVRCAECQEVFQHRHCNACDTANVWKDANYDKTLSVECCQCEQRIPPVETNEESDTNSDPNEANASLESLLLQGVITLLNLKK